MYINNQSLKSLISKLFLWVNDYLHRYGGSITDAVAFTKGVITPRLRSSTVGTIKGKPNLPTLVLVNQAVFCFH